MDGQESAIATVITCHNCRRPRHQKKYCNQLKKRSNKSSHAKNGKKKCSYHQTNGHLHKDFYQQQSESANLDNKKIWCTYHNSASHSNDECFHQRGNKFENSFSVDGKNSEKQKIFIADSTPTGCDATSCCKCKGINTNNESDDKSNSPPPGLICNVFSTTIARNWQLLTLSRFSIVETFDLSRVDSWDRVKDA